MLTWQAPADAAHGWQVDTALVDTAAGGFAATGSQLGLRPMPYRLEWALETGGALVTRRLTVWAQGEEWSRSLHLTHDGLGRWAVTVDVTGDADLPDPGGDTDRLAGALDCDLGRCPLTNTMPVLRHRLHEVPGERDLLMAWVSVPDLRVVPSAQRYTHLPADPRGAPRVRYSSGDFTADLTLDDAALVVDYPGLCHRVR